MVPEKYPWDSFLKHNRRNCRSNESNLRTCLAKSNFVAVYRKFLKDRNDQQLFHHASCTEAIHEEHEEQPVEDANHCWFYWLVRRGGMTYDHQKAYIGRC